MKKILAIICVLLSLSCKSQEKEQINDTFINISEVKESVQFLTSDALKGRNTGTEGIEMAANYIENIFNKNNIKPYFETYRDTFKVKDFVGSNIVGFIEGNDPELKNEIVVIGAHYDHIGFGKVIENDSIANGANDNAAGTSAVLAFAEYFSNAKSNKRSIIFALFSGEEMGLLGSDHLAKKLKEQNVNLYTMLNFEMIGVPFKDRDYEAFVTGYDLSNMAEKMNAYIGSNYIGKSDVSVKYSLFKRSDNYPFYTAFNVPCQTISSCDLTNYDYYHHVDDEADKLDYEHMSNLITAMIPALVQICNSPTKEIKMNDE
ncbi:M28 family peptidase [Gaetbulibacter sp. M235]|uniref:M28 family peptidase n=1 Tax=Gaetbulibacter sp. M235 TaxID=3126510 RepID=UPI00374EFCDC